MIEVIGKVSRSNLGIGAWVLRSNEGKTYELKDAPADLCAVQGQVKVIGQIRDDVMTLAMVGPVLQVISFEIGD